MANDKPREPVALGRVPPAVVGLLWVAAAVTGLVAAAGSELPGGRRPEQDAPRQ